MKGKSNVTEFDDLDKALGNPNTVDNFSDNKARKLYHVPLAKFSAFMKNIASVDYMKLWTNFLDENTTKALTDILEISFKDENMEELLELINAENYPVIMNKILMINGIELKSESSEGNTKKKG